MIRKVHQTSGKVDPGTVDVPRRQRRFIVKHDVSVKVDPTIVRPALNARAKYDRMLAMSV